MSTHFVAENNEANLLDSAWHSGPSERKIGCAHVGPSEPTSFFFFLKVNLNSDGFYHTHSAYHEDADSSPRDCEFEFALGTEILNNQ